MIFQIIQLLMFICIAMISGKLISKLKLPAILGWLITGIVIGPHALGWMSQDLLDSTWFNIVICSIQVGIGLLIGTELIWDDIKNFGKQVLIICFTEAFGAFFSVTFCFSVIFIFMDIPIYIAFLFGGIALATAPAPSLSIVKEYNSNGPVTKTLIPLAALDDVLGLAVFFTIIGVVSGIVSGEGFSLYVVFLRVAIPIVLGIILGALSVFILRKDISTKITCLFTSLCIIITSLIGMYINMLIGSEFLNLMLLGVSFTATFSNLIPKERVHKIRCDMDNILGLIMITGILYLGSPLDYHLILDAGIFTAVYIIARALGKIFGSYLGGVISNSPDTVKKYLGFTLLPHSGVSLIFTGICVTTLNPVYPQYAQIIQGTIAAAAIINEIIAVFLAKQAFKWSGEITNEHVDDTCKDLVN